jgi:hypothetical protein
MYCSRVPNFVQVGGQMAAEASSQAVESQPYESSAQAFEYQPSSPISYQPSPPISYQPSPPISYQPSPPISYQPSPVYQRPPYYMPATTLPESVAISSAPLINNQVNLLFGSGIEVFWSKSRSQSRITVAAPYNRL